jgi:hypothetical protein
MNHNAHRLRMVHNTPATPYPTKTFAPRVFNVSSNTCPTLLTFDNDKVFAPE